MENQAEQGTVINMAEGFFGEATEVALKDIKTNPVVFQVRESIDADTVERFAEKGFDFSQLPPVELWQDDKGQLWLIHGWHRVTAAQKRGLEAIRARVLTGASEAEARIHSYRANLANGKSLTKSEHRAAVVSWYNTVFLGGNGSGAKWLPGWSAKRLATETGYSVGRLSSLRNAAESHSQDANVDPAATAKSKKGRKPLPAAEKAKREAERAEQRAAEATARAKALAPATPADAAAPIIPAEDWEGEDDGSWDEDAVWSIAGAFDRLTEVTELLYQRYSDDDDDDRADMKGYIIDNPGVLDRAIHLLTALREQASGTTAPSEPEAEGDDADDVMERLESLRDDDQKSVVESWLSKQGIRSMIAVGKNIVCSTRQATLVTI